MPNLRIVYDNAADRATTTASTTAGTLVVANLLTDIKSQVWRSTSTTSTLTSTWTAPEVVSCVALPFCNFTSTATLRVRCYTNVADATPVLDTGTVLACAYAPFGLWDWGMMPLGVNAYSYGGGAYGVIWFAPQAVRKVVIDIVDTDNTAAYVEASRLIIGAYWSPTYNADYGAAVTMTDNSVHQRNDAGDLLTDIGTRSRKITLNMSQLTDAERARMIDILRGNGLPRPIFFSLFPESDDPVQEQTYQIYCKLSQIDAVTNTFLAVYTAPIQLEEI